MDPPRIHIFHYHKFNMSTNLWHPQLHNSNQISQSDFKNINWNDPKGSPVSHDVYPVFPWCWSNLDHRVYRGVVTREVHLMMAPTRIHTSPLSWNQYAKQPWASRTFYPYQMSLLVFKKIIWNDPKGSPLFHDIHLGCSSDAGQTWITEYTGA